MVSTKKKKVIGIKKLRLYIDSTAIITTISTVMDMKIPFDCLKQLEQEYMKVIRQHT